MNSLILNQGLSAYPIGEKCRANTAPKPAHYVDHRAIWSTKICKCHQERNQELAHGFKLGNAFQGPVLLKIPIRLRCTEKTQCLEQENDGSM